MSKSRTNQSFVESAINGMLAGLDPHSSYIDPNSFREMQVETRGEFGGLGMEVTIEAGLLKVVARIDDTPAAKAGVMANDIITRLDKSRCTPDIESSGRENPRPDAHQDQAHHHAQGAGQADRHDYHSRPDTREVSALAQRR